MRAPMLKLLMGILMGSLIWSAPGQAHDRQSSHDNQADHNHQSDHDHQSDRDRGSVYEHESDHERARSAHAAGEALSLQEVLQRVARDYPGQLLKVEFEQDDGIWIYELRILQDQGRLLKLTVDARDASVLAMRRKPARHQGGR